MYIKTIWMKSVKILTMWSMGLLAMFCHKANDVEALSYILTAFNNTVSKEGIHLLWRNKCVRCRRTSVVIHEIIPKSLLPGEWQSWQNQVALCSECHENAHAVGTVNSKQELRDFQILRLKQYYVPETAKYLIGKLQEWWSKH